MGLKPRIDDKVKERERGRERERESSASVREGKVERKEGRKEMSGAGLAMKRIPRIRFPQRHQNPPGSVSQAQVASSHGKSVTSRSDVPAPPTDIAVGGNASVQPKRTPVSEREIEAILLGGCF